VNGRLRRGEGCRRKSISENPKVPEPDSVSRLSGTSCNQVPVKEKGRLKGQIKEETSRAGAVRNTGHLWSDHFDRKP